MASDQEQLLMDVLRLEEAGGSWVEALPSGTRGIWVRPVGVSLDLKYQAIRGGVGLLFDLE